MNKQSEHVKIEKRPNRELVVYVLGLLGGDAKLIHTEDIALEAHKLFPDKFSWVQYPNFPDKETVRIALTDARKPRYGALVKGRAGLQRNRVPDGWTLTNKGIKWFNSEANLLATNDEMREQLLGRRQKIQQRLKRIIDHPVFRTYEKKPEKFSPSLGDVASLVRCRVDAPENVWAKRFEALWKDAEASQRKGLPEFVEKCQVAYRNANNSTMQSQS